MKRLTRAHEIKGKASKQPETYTRDELTEYQLMLKAAKSCLLASLLLEERAFPPTINPVTNDNLRDMRNCLIIFTPLIQILYFVH